ncbi:MAG: hypothetical protein LQ345_002102 [Seirophora villosa]|nr:MAG: hypothetical protein LQ345_002102 [Seirophora villosa]
MPSTTREAMSISDNRLDAATTTFEPPTTSTGSKRKRDLTDTNPVGVGIDHSQGRTYKEQLHQLFKDTVEILRSYDISPLSILDYPIPSAPSGSPVAKKAKLAAPPNTSSIAHLVESNAYNSIDDLSKDLGAVTASIIETLENKTSATDEVDKTRIKTEGHPDVARTIAFKQEFNKIILRELLQRPYLMERGGSTDESSTAQHAKLDTASLTSTADGYQDNRAYETVLTLFGGSNQPRQLFSSLKDQDSSSAFGRPLNYRIPEVGLPNGISFTSIVPVHSRGRRDDVKDIPVLKELFAPPSNIQPLNPPRQSRHTATRSSSVNWYNPTEATTPSRPNRRDSFATQPLSTGQWLTYNVAPSTKDLSSPDSKRKQRDRALSFGEPQNELSEQTLAVHRQAKEDALFRSVYSTFAPDRDNTGALVSERNKNRLWWKRIGEERYLASQLHEGEPIYDDEEDLPMDEMGMSDDIEGVSLQEAVESWVPEEIPPELLADKQSAQRRDPSAKDTDEILGEISELLETLNSYQDIRNLSLTTNARTPASQNPQLSAMTGTPTSPSADELDIYNMLKSQLSIMVSSLPPYALAKLDGKKLGVLNVNTTIQVETPNYGGSLEEDEISTKGRLPVGGVAAGYPTRTPSAAVGLAPRNNYLAATSTPAALSHRPSHMPQTVPARSTAAPSYLPNQQYQTRPPSANQYFASNARSAYASQRPSSASTPEQFRYPSSQQYGQQAARQSYTNGYSQYGQQNGTAYGQGYAHSQQGSANARVSQSAYQPPVRPSQSYSYTPTPTPSGGGASPSKAAAMQYASQSPMKASSTAAQGRAAAYQQPTSQSTLQRPLTPQVNGTNGSPRLRPSSDQSVQVNRPKAVVGEAVQGNSSTSQPMSTRQKEAGQQNGVTAVQKE